MGWGWADACACTGTALYPGEYTGWDRGRCPLWYTPPPLLGSMLEAVVHSTHTHTYVRTHTHAYTHSHTR